jgi:phytoene dehydrogenase-like protein
VQRAHFDDVLIREAQKQGAEVRFRHVVEAVDVSGAAPVVTVRDPDGSVYQVESRFLLDASGFGRVLPRLLDLESPSNFPVRAAIFTHVADRIPGQLRSQQDPRQRASGTRRCLVLDHPVLQRALLAGRGGREVVPRPVRRR